MEKRVVINYKKESFPDHTAVLDIERGKLDTMRPPCWQTDTAVDKRSWGYIPNPDYKSVDSIVDDLVDIVSKSGSLLLNIGSRPDGTIPEQQEKMLLDIGRWLAVNGEAVYGTRPWKIYGEGPTHVVSGSLKDTASRPESGKLVINSLATQPVTAVQLLGSKDKLKWVRASDGLHIELPAQKPCDYAFAFQIR